MTMQDTVIIQTKTMLQNLGTWLEKAAAYAKEKSFDPDVLLQARLAPDQFPLVRQVQSACDSAKFVPARLGGVDAPTYADDEKTFADIQKRVSDVVAFLDGVAPGALAGSADKKIVMPFFPEGSWVSGADYVNEFAVPNFFFHVTTAYAILRHNGVPLGKRDFIRTMNVQS